MRRRLVQILPVMALLSFACDRRKEADSVVANLSTAPPTASVPIEGRQVAPPAQELTPPKLLHRGEEPVMALSVDGDFVFFVTSVQEPGQQNRSDVWRLARGGGQATRWFRADMASAPLVVGDTLYYTTRSGDVMRRSTSGGDASLLLADWSLDKVARKLKPRAHGSTPLLAHLAMSAGNLYFLSPQRGAVVSLPLSGGRPRLIARHEAPVHALAADASHVYYTTENIAPPGESQFGGAQLYRAPIDGTAPSSLLATLGDISYRIVLTSNSVVWSDTDGTVAVLPKSGGAVGGGVFRASEMFFHRNLLWSTEHAENGTVRRIDLTTQHEEFLAIDLPSPSLPVVSDGVLFFATQGFYINGSSTSLTGCCDIFSLSAEP